MPSFAFRRGEISSHFISMQKLKSSQFFGMKTRFFKKSQKPEGKNTHTLKDTKGKILS